MTGTLNAALVVLTVAAIPSITRAELRWETTQIEISPASADSPAPAEFRFTNVGKTSAKILDVHPDCGCVLPAPFQQTYEPGESGRVSLVFKGEGQLERRDVPISVTIATGGETTHAVLVLHVRVRETVQFSEKFVYWRAGQPLEPRTVFITLNKEEGLVIQTVASDSPVFRLDLVRTADPEKYVLRVTPPPEHGRAFAQVIVTTTSAKDSTPREHRLIARVW